MVSLWSDRQLVVQEHRHDEHQYILVLGLLGRNDDASAAGIGQLNLHLVALQVVEDLGERATLEADVHRLACILASDNLLSAGGEVDVL